MLQGGEPAGAHTGTTSSWGCPCSLIPHWVSAQSTFDLPPSLKARTSAISQQAWFVLQSLKPFELLAKIRKSTDFK